MNEKQKQRCLFVTVFIGSYGSVQEERPGKVEGNKPEMIPGYEKNGNKDCESHSEEQIKDN